jgi:predicted RNase H-like HicB family nuclease
MDYIAIIHKDEGSDYGVSFPDFPGCITAGRTLDEAKDMAREALAGHLEVMREAGERIPDPSSLDEVMCNPDFQDGVGFLVDVKAPGKTVRVNITLSEGELEQIDQRARAQGLSRSAFLVQSGLRALVIALAFVAAAGSARAGEAFDWDRYHDRQDACRELDQAQRACTQGYCDELALRQATRACSPFTGLGGRDGGRP